jgi:long-chain fatty acid transport protein
MRRAPSRDTEASAAHHQEIPVMTTLFHRAHAAGALAGFVFALGAGEVLGAAFGLQTQNASGLGHAYAGGAAAAEDVSTIFYNPAGLVRLQKTEMVLSANVICPEAKFQNDASQAALYQPLGGTGGDAGGCAVVPNFYVGVPFTDKWSFGLGINAPFGLETEYDSDWLGRFQAIKSKLETVNVNPVLSWEPTKTITIGAGVSWQKLKADITKNANYAALYAQGVGGLVASGQVPAAAAPTLIGAAYGLQSAVKISGDDYSWGWNIGALWQVTPQTRIGAAYRSPIKYDVSGNIQITNPTAANLGPLPPALAPVGAAIVAGVNANPALASGGVTLAVKMPETANLSIFSEVNKEWDVMADLQYTGWSSIEQLQIMRTTGAPAGGYTWNFRNTWRVSAGVNYKYSDKWVFRGGVAYDQTPTNDTDRTPGLPDNDRTWLAFGVHYNWTPNWEFDVAYAHEFLQNPSINQNGGNAALYGVVNGSVKEQVNIVGAQVKYVFK